MVFRVRRIDCQLVLAGFRAVVFALSGYDFSVATETAMDVRMTPRPAGGPIGSIVWSGRMKLPVDLAGMGARRHRSTRSKA